MVKSRVHTRIQDRYGNIRFEAALSILLLFLALSGCGKGFAVSTRLTKTYKGKQTEYCSLPSQFSNLPSQESFLAADQLTALRAKAESLVSQNRLQEAIWLYLDDPQGAETIAGLQQRLAAALTSDQYQIENSSLGGSYEKYVLVFSNGMKAIFKPTHHFYEEVAAYRLDNLLQLGLVPMTLARVINGRSGTVQYFVPDMVPGSVAHVGSKNFRRMIIFDFLIRNRDRHLNNFLFWSDQNRIIAIDHGLAFSKPCGVADEIKEQLEVEKTLARRLSRLSARQLFDGLGDIPNFYKKIIWNQLNRIQ